MSTKTKPAPLVMHRLEVSNLLRLEHLTVDAQGRHVLITGKNGAGKCIPEGTPVALWNGSRKPIQDIRETDVLVGMNPKTCQWVPEHPLRMTTSGVQEVFEVVTRSGHRVRATAGHRLLTPDGWKELRHLSPKDYLAVPLRLPSGEVVTAISESEAMLLGLLLGDGCVRKGLQLTASDRGVQALFRQAVNETWPLAKINERSIPGVTVESISTLTVSARHGRGTREHIEWAKELGILGKCAYDKFVPEVIFGSGERTISLFLAGLFSTDGWVEADGWAQYASRSLALVHSIRSLMLRVGISSSIHAGAKRRAAGSPRIPFYTLTVVTGGGRRAFASKITPHMSQSRIHPTTHERLDQSRHFALPPRVVELLRDAGAPGLRQWIRKGARIGRDKFLQAVARLPHKERECVQRFASADVGWDRIKSIQSLGHTQTFDLSMPSEAFVANDFLVHNSTVQSSIWGAVRGLSSRQFPEPIHAGQDQARILLELGPPAGQVELTIERIITRSGMKLTVKDANGQQLKTSPQKFLDALWSEIAIDPGQFLLLRPQDQVDQVLAVCGVRPPLERVAEILGLTVPALPGESADAYLMRLSADEVGEVYVQRRVANRELEQKRHALAEQQQALQALGGPLQPAEQEQSIGQLLNEVQRLNAHAEERRQALAAAADAQAAVEEGRNLLSVLQAQDQAIDAEIADLEARLAAKRQEQAGLQQRIATGQKQILPELEARAQAAAQAADRLADPAPAMQSLQAKIQTAEADNARLSKRRAAQEQLERLGKEEAAAQAEWKRLDGQLDLLRNERLHLLDGVDLGIAGLRVGLGELRLNDVPFRQASQAEQLEVACSLAFKQEVPLRLLRLDSAEHLDSDAKALVMRLADQAGWQCCMTAVADTKDGALEVEFVEREVA